MRRHTISLSDIIIPFDIERGDIKTADVIGRSAYYGNSPSETLRRAENDDIAIITAIDNGSFVLEPANDRQTQIRADYVILRKKAEDIPVRLRSVEENVRIADYETATMTWLTAHHPDDVREAHDIAMDFFFHYSATEPLETAIEKAWSSVTGKPLFLERLRKALGDDEMITDIAFLVDVLADSVGVGYSSWIEKLGYDPKAEPSFPIEFDEDTFEERLAENAIRGTLVVHVEDDEKVYRPTLSSWRELLGRMDDDELSAIRDAYLEEADDAETADALLQMWVLGGVYYG